mmetsp:Transcript_27169/g.45446  ORF Transcript_27169/g.45446 Transcript_27169/m.45446 type:complete len:1029 (-) Transcript_27169:324-3410(-)|eukprot:CAMPEP_0198198774 /NCGR_PEP_ID=MMETSP1445-20131203/2167_1 /TAXON_ID=36898 /ORGANISM="Pyramimonas sp., Strain CCMP2087" /LENGTH=1028 /DNA_ID=CAMNT_0043868413 /DNA_START=52 /DNA_END=3138 /DNA_ORIENTATION=+
MSFSSVALGARIVPTAKAGRRCKQSVRGALPSAVARSDGDGLRGSLSQRKALEGVREFLGQSSGIMQTGKPSDRATKQVTHAMFSGLGKFLNRDPTEKIKKMYQPRVDAINKLEPAMQALSDEALGAKTLEFKERIAKGESLESALPEVFAVAREAAKRVLGLRPFDVQLMGGMILNEGQIAEMRTGEGKTLVAVLPAYLNALSGKGVHVVTVNDYLARRDAEVVGQVHRFLGLEVGLVQARMTEDERRTAYKSDITYVTNSELGFDYLRDNLAQTPEELVLRDFNFCIVDEVDSILIDEARTPLIISGQAEKPSERYIKCAKIADAMSPEVHYKVDEKQKSILLNEEGYEVAEDILQVTDLYDPREQWAVYLINALKAKELQKRDINYVVIKNEVIIVDEFTGRTMEGRRWGEGLHQAVEAKEGCPIQNETITLASISYQSFFLSYPKLAGMTGTAETELAEFNTIYNLAVAVVPTNRVTCRDDGTDVVFKTELAKWKAVCAEIKRMHLSGRPVLVGTTSVERSEFLAGLLAREEIPFQLLNAKPENVQRESEIVSQSGRRGAVTISTNMAGRGTDILLGGNPSFIARLKLREMLYPLTVQTVDDDIAFEKGNKKDSNKPAARKEWKADASCFPCELSEQTIAAAKSASEAAEIGWGKRALAELEVEDRLSFACEKAPTQDPVLLGLRAAFEAMVAEYSVVTSEEREVVRQLGGLHVVGTERHESRRIDNQLRGRSGRQGDAGSTRFFLSLEDNIFRIFGGDRIKNMMSAFQLDDVPIESGMLTKSLDEAQKKVETYFYDIRKQLFDYDNVLNQQREKIYYERRRALMSTDLSQVMIEYAEETVDDIVGANLDPAVPMEQWDFTALAGKMKQYCYMLDDLTPEMLKEKAQEGGVDAVGAYLRERGVAAYRQKVAEIEAVEVGLMPQAERFFVLTQTDNLWKEHLQAIKFIQQAVGLRGYAQRDPLIEYKLEGYNLFREMLAQVRRNVIFSVYQFRPKAVKTPEQMDAEDLLLAAGNAKKAKAKSKST